MRRVVHHLTKAVFWNIYGLTPLVNRETIRLAIRARRPFLGSGKERVLDVSSYVLLYVDF